MRLNTFTDYSLRVLMYVASSTDGRATVGEVAHAFNISENHLVKVVHWLGKTGLLNNVRGRAGGLRLAARPDAINIGSVVRLAETGDVPAECFNTTGNTCPITSSCRLRAVFNEALHAFYGVLEQYTLEDLIRNRAVLAKALFYPPAAVKRRRA